MRKRTPRALSLIAMSALLAGACGDDDQPVSAPTATTTAPAQSAQPSLAFSSPLPPTVKGNVVTIDLAATGVTIVKADGDTSGKTGHFHVFVDRDPTPSGQVIPREAGILHTADNPVKLTGLPIGSRRIVAVLGDGAHRRIGTGQAEGTVKVEGPSVQASASAQGKDVEVTAKVEGVQLVAADGDTSGSTGHLHLFVDREPTPLGQAIPREAGIVHTTDTTVSVPGLGAGEHTIWVVVGDGAHVPLNPLVGDKVTVTVQ